MARIYDEAEAADILLGAEANCDGEHEELQSGIRLHVISEGADEWQVWVDLELDRGICIGSGRTRGEAVYYAVQSLEEATNCLQRGPRIGQ